MLFITLIILIRWVVQPPVFDLDNLDLTLEFFAAILKVKVLYLVHPTMFFVKKYLQKELWAAWPQKLIKQNAQENKFTDQTLDLQMGHVGIISNGAIIQCSYL